MLSVSTSWSAVLKIFHKADGEPDPSQVFYWKREPLLYTSGFFSYLSSHLRVPTCFGITIRSEEETWLWLEAIPDICKEQWAISDYQIAARCLGRLNELYLAQNIVPTQPWLAKQILRCWLRDIAALQTYLNDFPHHPFIRRALPRSSRNRIVKLLQFISKLLNALESQSQTFCHLDCHKRNFFLTEFSDGGLDVFLIDWELAGLGALGQDLSPLVTVSAFMFETGEISLEDLDAAAFEAYLQGLRDAGWKGDQRIVRLGYSADATLRFLNRTRFLLGFVRHENHRFWWETVVARSTEATLDRFSEMLPFMFNLADEAIHLLKIVGKFGQ